MRSIKILDKNLADQISAGEVVERPASVVKEVLENSIDAFAQSIEVDVEGGGRKLIKIHDDGLGIPKNQISLALTRHATSKIETLEELEQALEAGCDGVLLDNLASHVLARAVNMADAHRRRFRRDIVIEASGDISLRNVREVADTGVDRISIGGLTKHIRATDFSMRMHTD